MNVLTNYHDHLTCYVGLLKQIYHKINAKKQEEKGNCMWSYSCQLFFFLFNKLFWVIKQLGTQLPQVLLFLKIDMEFFTFYDMILIQNNFLKNWNIYHKTPNSLIREMDFWLVYSLILPNSNCSVSENCLYQSGSICTIKIIY